MQMTFSYYYHDIYLIVLVLILPVLVLNSQEKAVKEVKEAREANSHPAKRPRNRVRPRPDFSSP